MRLSRTIRSLHGNKVAAAIAELHRVENDLAGELLSVSDRHKVDHEVFYVARDVARWSQEHVRRISETGHDYGLALDPDPGDETTILARMKQKGSELSGGFHKPSLLLLADMRRIHRAAAGASLDWEVLAQSAQAMKDTRLLAVAEQCHPQTLRQMRWANAKVKETAAQIMVTG